MFHKHVAQSLEAGSILAAEDKHSFSFVQGMTAESTVSVNLGGFRTISTIGMCPDTTIDARESLVDDFLVFGTERLQDDVPICATHAEPAHTHSTASMSHGPSRKFCCHCHVPFFEGNGRIRLRKMDVGWYETMLHGQDTLYDAGHTGSSFEMTNLFPVSTAERDRNA